MIPGVPYDAEVEYIEGTGTQWIDTRFVATGGCVMEFRFYPHSFGNSSCAMGSHSKTSTNAYNRNVVLLNSSSFLTFAKCEKYGQSSAGVDLSSGFHTYYFDSTGYNRIGKVDDTVRINDTTQYELAPDTSVLMWMYGWDNHIMSGRFAWAKIWNASRTLVRDFIPVRFTNELGQAEGAMFDRVSRKLFRNQGTGDPFVLGPDKAATSVPVMGLHFMRSPATTQ